MGAANEGRQGMDMPGDFVGQHVQTPADTFDATGSENWLSPGRFALLLGVLIAALFPHVIFGNETFFYRDYGVFGFPLAKYHRDCFWSGHFPVWNSLNACGLPFLAQWNTLTLYPLSLIYLLLPLPWSLSFFCLVHLFLAGLGMYFLARFWTKDSFAAAIAGAAFAFNGLTLNCLMWPNNIAGLAWMPWVVWAVQRGWQQGGRAVILAALAGGVQALSGAPEIILFTWLILLVLFINEVVARKFPRSITLLRAALIFVLVFGLAAAQLLPFIDLLGHSERHASYAGSAWAMPMWGWVNLVLPYFRSYASDNGVYFQVDQGWTCSYYPGVGVLFLALFALSSRTLLVPAKRAWLLWALAAFGLIMALGEKGLLYSWVHKAVPLLGFIRFPIKFVLLPIFVLPLLAAIAVAGFRSRVEAPEGPETQATGISHQAIVIWTLITAVIGSAILFSCWHPYYDVPWSDVLQNGLVRIVFLTLLAGILFRLRHVRDRRVGCSLQSAAVLCLVLDVWTHMPTQNPTVGSAVYEPGLITRQLDPKCASGQARAMLSKRTHDLLYKRALPDANQDFLGRRAGLLANLNLLDGIATPDGFYSLNILEQRQIWETLFFMPLTNFPAGLADFVGISELTTNLFEWQRRPSAQPLITVGARPAFVDGKTILNRLSESSFDPRQIVYLPMEAKSSLSVTNGSSARISKQTFRAGQITAEVEASEPALLVVAESYYDGWQATVDGKPAKIWRANHAFQAVEVPAGHRRVELIYKEKHLFVGSLISGSTLLGCLAGWFRTRKKAVTPVFE